MRIGVSGPFSGKRQTYGQLIRNCTESVRSRFFANEDIEFLFKDDKAEVNEALNVAHFFKNANVDGVIGHFNSSCAKAVSEVYHRNKIPFVAPASTTIALPYEGEGFVFRTCPNNQEQTQQIVDFCLISNIRKIGLVSDQTNYARELLSIMQDLCGKHKIDFCKVEPKSSVNDGVQALWFMGTHFFCMEAAQYFIKEVNFKGVMLFCDDCYIDEFIHHFSDGTSGIYIVGIPDGGYEKVYNDSLRRMIICLKEHQKLDFKKGSWKLIPLKEILHEHL